jgi:hypothetical protein
MGSNTPAFFAARRDGPNKDAAFIVEEKRFRGRLGGWQLRPIHLAALLDEPFHILLRGLAIFDSHGQRREFACDRAQRIAILVDLEHAIIIG